MKVVHCIGSLDLSSGGPSRSLPNICIGLKRKDVDQHIITYATQNPNSDNLIKENIELSFIPNTRMFGFDYKKAIDKVTGDVFHLHSLWNPILHWAALKCRNNSIPYIISPRGTLEPWPLSQKIIKKRLSWFLYQKNDLLKSSCIHATSESEAINIRNLGIDTPIAVIPNGINVENYPCFKSVGSEEKIILFLSRISPKKGVESLIRAWLSLPPNVKKGWKIRIVGEGDNGLDDDYYFKIKKLIKFSDLEDTVILTGPKYGKDKIEELKNASLFILPTYSENFGMVIAEAMLSGVPVITTKETPWKILNDKKVGWWIDNTDEELIETMTKAMILSKEERFQMGMKSRQIIIDNFSIDIVSSKYNRLYNWILSKSHNLPDFFLK